MTCGVVDQFRIIPYGVDKWAVEHRTIRTYLVGSLWWKREESMPSRWEIDSDKPLNTEAEAERYIKERSAYFAESRERRRMAEERKEKISPRIYP